MVRDLEQVQPTRGIDDSDGGQTAWGKRHGLAEIGVAVETGYSDSLIATRGLDIGGYRGVTQPGDHPDAVDLDADRGVAEGGIEKTDSG